MCRCRTVSVHSLALSSSMSNRFQRLFQAPSWRASSAGEVVARRDSVSRASSRLSEIARSREVNRATTFSTVAGRPCSSSKVSSWATNPGSSTSRRSAWATWPSRSSLVRAARATRTCDWVVSTCRSTVSSSTSAWPTTVRWRLFRSR